MQPKQKQKTSKFISLILRHDPEIADVKLDAEGWANVSELLDGLNKSGHTISLSDLEEIVSSDEKQRYSFGAGGTMIRANQGHSIPINLNLQPVEPPEVLFHGTSDRFESSIRNDGLLKMSRQYVHLSQLTETAEQVGKRHGGKLVILNVNAKQMYDKGHTFFKSENGIWLTEHVPTEFIS